MRSLVIGFMYLFYVTKILFYHVISTEGPPESCRRPTVALAKVGRRRAEVERSQVHLFSFRSYLEISPLHPSGPLDGLRRVSVEMT